MLKTVFVQHTKNKITLVNAGNFGRKLLVIRGEVWQGSNLNPIGFCSANVRPSR